MKDVKLNEGLRKIGKFALQDCVSLEKLILPSTVTEVAMKAFDSCGKFKSVVFNEGLRNIGKHAFLSCVLYH